MNQPDDKMLRKIFWIMSAIIFLYMIVVTPEYGISGDGVTQYNYGTHVWNYIKSFGADKAVLTDEYILKKELQYYGGFFDGFAAMLIAIFKPRDEYLLRHYWCMLFGFIGLLATGLTAKEIGGWRAGILALVFLFFTGRYLGEAFNNPKDPPFAATYILAIYAMIVWLKNAEKPKWKQTALLGLAIGLCLSIRIGGLLLFGYLAIFSAFILWQRKLISGPGVKPFTVHFIAACIIGYVFAILWWPFALEAPLSNPLVALKVMSSYPLQVKMLFEGNRIDSSQVPWYYLSKWLLIGLPIYLIVGFIGGTAMFLRMSKQYSSSFIWMIIFTVLFPVIYILYKGSVLYDGLRHAMFVIPSMAVISALLFNYLIAISGKKSTKYVIAGLLVVLVALPARFLLANQPNEYLYFNELTGGIKGAYGIYETDYYMNSAKQAFEWLNENELNKVNKNDTVVLATNTIEPVWHYVAMSSLPINVIYSRFYQKNEQQWDYAIYYSRFLDREQLENGYFPKEVGGRTIHIVEADGVPLCVVMKNDKEQVGYKGVMAMRAGDTTNAVRYLTEATKKYPQDMELWNDLALVFMNTGNANGAREAIRKAYEVSSLDLQTSMMAGEIALGTGDINWAMQIYGAMTENYPNMGNGYLGLAKVQAVQGNYDLALENVNHSNELAVEAQDGNLMKQGYMTLAFIYQKKGDMATAQKYYQAAQGGQ